MIPGSYISKKTTKKEDSDSDQLKILDCYFDLLLKNDLN